MNSNLKNWLNVTNADGTELSDGVVDLFPAAVTPPATITPTVTAGVEKVVLSAMTPVTGHDFYYTSSAASVSGPALDDLISGITNATVFTSNTDISGTADVEKFVQVYEVENSSGKIKGYGEASATPTAPAELGGSVSITGTPKFNQQLTADISSLTNNASSATLSYQWKRNGTTNIGTGNTYTTVEADIDQTITVDVTSSAESGTISGVGVEIAKADGPGAPSTAFAFNGTNAGKLMGATTLMEYSLDGGANWLPCTADIALTVADITATDDIQVRVKTTNTHAAGAAQTIDITAGGAVTGVGKTDCTTASNNDGQLTGVTTLMEYKLSSANVWTPGTGNDITGLVPGTYQVRVKATGTTQAGAVSSFTIAAFNVGVLGGTVSITGTPKFDQQLTANTDNVTNKQGEFTYQWKRAGANIDNATTADYTLVEADIGKIITVEVGTTLQGNKLAASTAAVAKADGPAVVATLTPTAPTAPGGTDGRFTCDVVDGTLEYSTDATFTNPAGTVISSSPVTGKTAGDYYVRVKATTTHNAGANTTVTIPVGSYGALTGTATITGDAIYGSTLTATLVGGNNTGTLSYRWKANGNVIDGATSNTYTLTGAEMGAVITVEITSNHQTGTRTSADTTTVVKADAVFTGVNLAQSVSNIGSATAVTATIAPADDATTPAAAEVWYWIVDDAEAEPVTYKWTNVWADVTAYLNGKSLPQSIPVAYSTTGSANINAKIAPTVEGDAVATLALTKKSEGGGGGGGVAVKSITVSPESVTVALGHDPMTLTATIEPENATSKKINWKSSDKKVVTVDTKGVLTFVGLGKATITASVGGKNATVAVNVLAEMPDVSFVDKEISAPYAKGYEGEFHPDNFITRSEVAAFFSRILKEKFDEAKDYPTELLDVPADQWYKNNVAFLEQFNILQGDGMGQFYPDRNITRAEMASIIFRAENMTMSKNKNTTYADIGEIDWAEGYLTTLVEAGIFKGFPDGTLRPSAYITRAETVVLIDRLLKPGKTAGDIRPTDVASDYWAYDAIIRSMNKRELTEQ